jgi:hypothetical protein
VGKPLESVQVAGLGAQQDSFVLTLRYAGGSVATISYLGIGGPELRKERIEAFAGGRSAVIDDFRRVDVFPRPRVSRARRTRQDKGHRALIEASFEFFRRGGEPPIPYERMLETTRATLIARELLRRGDAAAAPVPAA